MLNQCQMIYSLNHSLESSLASNPVPLEKDPSFKFKIWTEIHGMFAQINVNITPMMLCTVIRAGISKEGFKR